VIGRVCLFVCSLTWRRMLFLEKQKSNFYEIWQGCPAYAPNVTVDF